MWNETIVWAESIVWDTARFCPASEKVRGAVKVRDYRFSDDVSAYL